MDSGNSLGSGMKKITDDFYVDKTKELGKGNFGVVYKGYHLSTNRLIAVKFVEKKMLAKFPDHEREIMVMHDLAKINHPHIMGYYGYEENEEGLFCFIEFCNGGTLKDLIKAKISEMKVLSLYRQMLDAMTYINEQSTHHLTQTRFIAISSLIIFCLTKMESSKLLTSGWHVMWRPR